MGLVPPVFDMHMYRALSTFLVILAMAPAYAAPLKSEDWWTEAPSDSYTLQDGTLTLKNNTSGKEFYYLVKEGTKPMVNGSGLSITLQFDADAFLEDLETGFYVCFKPDNEKGEHVDGKAFFHKFTVQNIGGINIYDLNSDPLDVTHQLSDSDGLVTIKVNYTIKDNYLHYGYTLNGKDSPVYVWSKEKVNPDLDWRPSFGLSNTETNSFTVTDVTFITVPEPTSSVLSLLALAGLAAHRRRWASR